MNRLGTNPLLGWLDWLAVQTTGPLLKICDTLNAEAMEDASDDEESRKGRAERIVNAASALDEMDSVIWSLLRVVDGNLDLIETPDKDQKLLVIAKNGLLDTAQVMHELRDRATRCLAGADLCYPHGVYPASGTFDRQECAYAWNDLTRTAGYGIFPMRVALYMLVEESEAATAAEAVHSMPYSHFLLHVKSGRYIVCKDDSTDEVFLVDTMAQLKAFDKVLICGRRGRCVTHQHGSRNAFTIAEYLCDLEGLYVFLSPSGDKLKYVAKDEAESRIEGKIIQGDVIVTNMPNGKDDSILSVIQAYIKNRKRLQSYLRRGLARISAFIRRGG